MQSLSYLYLTVIVPAYNVSRYIERCLDSLIQQTEMNHQILVVNDGSTDNTGEILARYAESYPDLVKVITQENKGLGAARNTGLQYVNTPFVTFLDSDDWEDPQFVEKVRILLERQEELPDIVFSLPWNFDVGCNRLCRWKDCDLMNQIFFRAQDTRVCNVRNEHALYALEPSTNRRIYRMDFLRRIDLHFTEGRKWEDVVPHFMAVHHAERCIAIRDTGFYYRINNGSQITSGGGASRLDVVPVFKEILAKATEEQWEDYEIAYIIRMMLDFVKWSIEVTNVDYIDQLLSDLHVFFQSISSRYFKLYLQICPVAYRLDWLLCKLLRGPFYGLLKDYTTRDLGIRVFCKMKRILRRD